MEGKKCPKFGSGVRHEGHSFYVCRGCARRFRLTSAGGFVERWGGPLSLVLYPVIFSKNPQEQARQIGESLCGSTREGERSIFRRFSLEHLKLIQLEIANELQNPTQGVKQILDCRASEADLRKYLTAVAVILAEHINDQRQC